MDERRAYRRGRWLLLTLAAVTAGGYAFDSVMDFLSDGAHKELSDLISGWLLLGFFCWSLLRGGVTGRVVFILLYSMFFLLFLLGTICTFIALIFYRDLDFTNTNSWLYSFHNLKHLFTGIVLGLWSAWSLRVLIFSRDAGLYLRSRRRGVIIAEANAFEWPPPHRHQG